MDNFNFLVGDPILAIDDINKKIKGKEYKRYDPVMAKLDQKQIKLEDIISEMRNMSLFDDEKIIIISSAERIKVLAKSDKDLSKEDLDYREEFFYLLEKQPHFLYIFLHYEKLAKNTRLYKRLAKISRPKEFKRREKGGSVFSLVKFMKSGNHKKSLELAGDFMRDGILDRKKKRIKDQSSIMMMILGALAYDFREKTYKGKRGTRGMARRLKALREADLSVKSGDDPMTNLTLLIMNY